MSLLPKPRKLRGIRASKQQRLNPATYDHAIFDFHGFWNISSADIILKYDFTMMTISG